MCSSKALTIDSVCDLTITLEEKASRWENDSGERSFMTRSVSLILEAVMNETPYLYYPRNRKEPNYKWWSAHRRGYSSATSLLTGLSSPVVDCFRRRLDVTLEGDIRVYRGSHELVSDLNQRVDWNKHR